MVEVQKNKKGRVIMELVLPNNYVEIEEEEMMYLDGGWSWKMLGKNLLGVYNWASRTQSKGVGMALRAVGFASVAKNLAYGVVPGSMNYVAGIMAKAATKLVALAPWAAFTAITVLGLGAWYLSSYRVFY